MRVLELFCGTKSVGRAFAAHGSEVTSLDNVESLSPDICCDILTWDYIVFPGGHFDCVWASPRCTQYSIARPKAKTPRDLEGADALVQRALDIIAYFKPSSWFMENPASGLLTTRRVIHAIPNVTVSYCKYGHPYQKHTQLWGTVLHHNWRPKCRFDCAAVLPDGTHGEWAQKASRGGTGFSTLELYAMPEGLCLDIVQASLFPPLRLSWGPIVCPDAKRTCDRHPRLAN